MDIEWVLGDMLGIACDIRSVYLVALAYIR